jgi:hypothetical protein
VDAIRLKLGSQWTVGFVDLTLVLLSSALEVKCGWCSWLVVAITVRKHDAHLN